MITFNEVDELFNIDTIDMDNPIYCDSVSGNSKLISNNGDYICIESCFKQVDKILGNKEYYYPKNNDLKILTLNNGKSFYGDIKYVMRHMYSEQMYRIHITNAEYIDVTKDHSIMTYLNKNKLKIDSSINERIVKTMPENLEGNSCIYLKYIPNVPLIEGEIYNAVKNICNNNKKLMLYFFQLLGYFLGNGSYSAILDKNYYIYLSMGIDKLDLIDKFISPLKACGIIKNVYSKNNFDIIINNIDLVTIFNKLRIVENGKNFKILPKEFLYLPEEFKIAFCQGYFEADGTVIKRRNSIIIRLTSVIKEYLISVQHILFTLGISSKIFTETNFNSYKSKISNTKSSYLVISSTEKFIEKIGFISNRKKENCNFFNSNFNKNTYKDFDFELAKNIRVEKLPLRKQYVYDIEVADTHVFFANNLLVHNTDSIFLQLPFSIEQETEQALKTIDYIQNTINNVCLDKFLKMHNIKIREEEEKPLLICDFKNEFMIKSMILYSKKRYISVIIQRNKNNEIYYDIDIKGVEGKRATNKFVKILVDDLIDYLKEIKSVDNIYNRNDIYYHIINKYKEQIYLYQNKSFYENIEYFSLPVNVNKQINDLKNVSGYYKGSMIFDIIGAESWKFSRGKGKWLKIVLKDESYIPLIINEYKKFENIKIAKKSNDQLIADLTIPDEYLQQENDVINKLSSIVEIDYDSYFIQLLQKISLMYKPFDEIFCNNLDIKYKKTLPLNFTIIGEEKIYNL